MRVLSRIPARVALPVHRVQIQRVGGLQRVGFFKFGKNGADAESAGIYGSQQRDDYTFDDLEQYFNYMGMLAVEGTYDRIESYTKAGIHPVDSILLFAVEEGDEPKIQEVLRAGANINVKDLRGMTVWDLAKSEKSKRALEEFAASAKK